MSFDESNTEPVNPYATTSHAGTEEDLDAWLPEVDPADKPFPTFGWTVLKWSLICGIAAIPSFYLGFIVTGQQAIGMLVGIGIFIAGYVWGDYITRPRPWRRSRRVQLTMRTVYILRLIASLAVPVGMVTDMFFGMLAVMFVTGFTGQVGEGSELSFFATVVTTIVQGVLLNLVMTVVGLCVYPIVSVIVSKREKKRRRSTQESSSAGDVSPLSFSESPSASSR
ncbi:hypothetical protein LOC71_19670 [Rhodopirellula sp. JC740]|uniref:Uncharacterized protein n=1 Tax=Rhodopirellula halodulae TaxID=2894198 RepID=A0ABS8NNJ1_9BACT|nr:hypothetical protein [Rhodopirellula sp. JC740]MCC9644497.1 hypothetical protein [Rhodopirellula sp. JC740]